MAGSVATSKMADELVDDMLYAARANDMEELQTGVCHCAIAFPDILEVDGKPLGVIQLSMLGHQSTAAILTTRRR